MPSDRYGKLTAPSLKNFMWFGSSQVLPRPFW